MFTVSASTKTSNVICFQHTLHVSISRTCNSSSFDPYTTTHWVTQLQLLMYSAAAFIFLQKTGLYPPELRSVNLDSDVLYRKLGPALVHASGRLTQQMMTRTLGMGKGILQWTLGQTRTHHSPNGKLGEPWPTGTAALWAAILLTVYLLVAFLTA